MPPEFLPLTETPYILDIQPTNQFWFYPRNDLHLQILSGTKTSSVYTKDCTVTS